MKLPKPPYGYEWRIKESPLSPTYDRYMLCIQDGVPVYDCFINLYERNPWFYRIEIRRVIRKINKKNKQTQPWKGQGLFT